MVGAANAGIEPTTAIATNAASASDLRAHTPPAADAARDPVVLVSGSGPELPPGALLRGSFPPLRGLFGVDAIGLVREVLLLSLLLELLLLSTPALSSQVAASGASRSLHRHSVSSPVGDAVYARRGRLLGSAREPEDPA